MNWKLTLATIGTTAELKDLLSFVEAPFEHEVLDTEDGALHLFTWLRESSQAAEHLDDKLSALFKSEFREFHIASFHCEGTWKKMELH